MAALKKKCKAMEVHGSDSEVDHRIQRAVEIMENTSSAIAEWDEATIRQLIDLVKILSADEILVCLHGGVEINQKMESKLSGQMASIV